MAPAGLNPAGVVAYALFAIALILVVARLVGGLFKRMGQPSVVGEIIAGVLLGPSLLGLLALPDAPSWLNCALGSAPTPEAARQTSQAFFLAVREIPIADVLSGAVALPAAAEATATFCLFPPQVQPILNVIGQLALLLFMFLVGLELDFKKLKGFGKPIALVTVGVVAIPVVFGFLIGPLLFGATTAAGDPVFVGPAAAESSLAFNLFIGAALSVTALPVMARILQEKGLAQSQMGTVGVASAAGVTVLMFVLVALAGAIARGASAAGLLVTVVLVVLYLGAMVLIVRPFLDRMITSRYGARVVARGGPDDPRGWSQVDAFAPAGIGWVLTHSMFAWIFVVVLVSGLVAHLLGLNVIVGGFMAGVVLPAREGLARDMLAELFDITVIVFLPVFLAFSGLNTNFVELFRNFGDAAVGLLVFLLAAIVSKVASAVLLGRAGGLSWGEGNALGILMNCRGLLPLAPALVALQANLITPTGQVTIVTMALVTTLMTGPLFDRFNPMPVGTPAQAGSPASPSP